MKLLRGTIAVGDALEYTVLVGGRVREDGARVHNATGFVDLGHRVARDDAVLVTLDDGAGGAPVYLEVEGDMRFSVRLAPAAASHDGGGPLFEGVGCFRRQRYVVALRWCIEPTLLETLGPVGTSFDAAAKSLEAKLRERCRSRQSERSKQERAAYVLKLPWRFRCRCLPLHHVACLWHREHHRHHDVPSPRIALGRLNADALQCVLEFLDGLCFLGFHQTREAGGVPAAPLLFVEHTGRFTMGVHVRLLCGGVYVRRPVFFPSGALQWFDADNSDSLRHTKPRNAQLSFTGMHDFTGTVTFPDEGSVRYHADGPPEVYPGVDIAMIREGTPPTSRRATVVNAATPELDAQQLQLPAALCRRGEFDVIEENASSCAFVILACIAGMGLCMLVAGILGLVLHGFWIEDGVYFVLALLGGCTLLTALLLPHFTGEIVTFDAFYGGSAKPAEERMVTVTTWRRCCLPCMGRSEKSCRCFEIEKVVACRGDSKTAASVTLHLPKSCGGGTIRTYKVRYDAEQEAAKWRAYLAGKRSRRRART